MSATERLQRLRDTAAEARRLQKVAIANTQDCATVESAMGCVLEAQSAAAQCAEQSRLANVDLLWFFDEWTANKIARQNLLEAMQLAKETANAMNSAAHYAREAHLAGAQTMRFYTMRQEAQEKEAAA